MTRWGSGTSRCTYSAGRGALARRQCLSAWQRRAGVARLSDWLHFVWAIAGLPFVAVGIAELLGPTGLDWANWEGKIYVAFALPLLVGSSCPRSWGRVTWPRLAQRHRTQRHRTWSVGTGSHTLEGREPTARIDADGVRSPLTASRTVGLGAATIQVVYRDGYEEICVLKGASAFEIARWPSAGQLAVALRNKLHDLRKKRATVIIRGAVYEIRTRAYDSFSEQAFEVRLRRI